MKKIGFRLKPFQLSLAVFAFAFSQTTFANFNYLLENPRQILSTYTLDCAYWYVGGNVGLSHLHDNKTPGSVDSVDQNGPGWSAYGGYRFNSMFGWELGYIQYYNSRESVGFGGHGSVIVAKTTHFAAYTALTGKYPLLYKISAVGKLGVAYSYALKEFTGGVSGSSGSGSLFTGLGLDYSVTKNADFIFEWSHVVGNTYTGSSDLISLGATYGFI